MAVVEIEETELLNYRNITAAVQKMLQNPQTRSKILEAQKIINPNAVIPELDAQKPVLTAVSALTEEVKALKKQREDDQAAITQEKALDGLKAKWAKGQAKACQAGYTAEGLKALEDFMEENGVADHMIAMPAFEKLNPPSAPIDTSGASFDRFQSMQRGEDDTKLLLEGNEQQFLTKRIKDTLSGIRNGNL